MLRSITKNRRGQGSAIGEDLPVIIMIVVAIGFFLGSLGFALNQINEAKAHINLKHAAVDASNTFMTENALIDEYSCQGGGFLTVKLKDAEIKYGVRTYAEITANDGTSGCTIGDPPKNDVGTKIIRTYPVAWKNSPLEIKPATIRITIWIG